MWSFNISDLSDHDEKKFRSYAFFSSILSWLKVKVNHIVTGMSQGSSLSSFFVIGLMVLETICWNAQTMGKHDGQNSITIAHLEHFVFDELKKWSVRVIFTFLMVQCIVFPPIWYLKIPLCISHIRFPEIFYHTLLKC